MSTLATTDVESATKDTAETNAPVRNRLADEDRSRAEYARHRVYIALFLAPFNAVVVVVAMLTDQPPPPHMLYAPGLWVVIGVVSWLRSRRYSRRADWMENTPQWWERLDEAPTLLLFPRLVYALRRAVNGPDRSRYRDM